MAIELPGQVFGEWTVLEDRGRSGGHAMVLARCSCGTEKVVRLKHLTSGASHSCHGFGSTVRTHGHASGSRHDTNRTTPEYNAWKMMRQRCSNPKNPNYKNYGARGIRVCEEWDRSFEAFLRDMGPRPSPDLSIDRINNDGNYEPGNCRWTTDDVQHANRRRGGPPANATPEQIEEIRRLLRSGESVPLIARAVGVGATTVRSKTVREGL